MALTKRIIPCLDVKNGRVVKGVKFVDIKDAGDPVHVAKRYNDQGADEITFLDITASSSNRNTILDVVANVASQVFIPLTVGGGIRSVKDIRLLLNSGADKITINTAAINNPDFIDQSSKNFGSSTIVISIEAIRQEDGSYLAYTDNGREFTGIEVFSWAKEAEERGAGEILLTCVDQEGVGKGFNLLLAEQICDALNIPVVIHGGAGSKDHVLNLTKDTPLSGVAIASLFHYDYILHNRQINGYEEEGNIEFLKSKRTLSSIQSISIEKLKLFLLENNISCRPNE